MPASQPPDQGRRSQPGAMAAQFHAEKHGTLVIAGAAGFALGFAAHAVLGRPTKTPAASTSSSPWIQTPPPPVSEATESVPNTPRLADDGANSTSKLRMALLVQIDEGKQELVGALPLLARRIHLQPFVIGSYNMDLHAAAGSVDLSLQDVIIHH